MEPRPFYLLPRVKCNAMGWVYVRWGRKLWLI